MNEVVRAVGAREWNDDVLGSEVPVLVDFWAAWCGPCQLVSPIVEQIAKEMADEIRVLKLDVDENLEVPAEHGIRSIPTLVLFSGGVERRRVVGAINLKEYRLLGTQEVYLCAKDVVFSGQTEYCTV